MIRFRIDDGEQSTLTEWVDEVLGDPAVQTAAMRVAELRRDYPTAAISLERSSIIPRKKVAVVRFKIVDGEATLYTIPFPIAERDEQLARLVEKYPDAEIIPEERTL